jgi:hypothetical protein
MLRFDVIERVGWPGTKKHRQKTRDFGFFSMTQSQIHSGTQGSMF